ncbi:hypothetical protein QJS64_12140 [Paraclostridium bifermentans]|uniref:Core-binding (CB) domain-containing protein n=1 Tax=Paraclostridium bifermentans TaxID=1490 RepID=A0ABY8R006_PARBF|nr:hypothetical protein QJS64_12140 [Paraclostridium bifermentans]
MKKWKDANEVIKMIHELPSEKLRNIDKEMSKKPNFDKYKKKKENLELSRIIYLKERLEKMDINAIIEEFVKIKPEGYEKDIRIFMEFLEYEKMPLAKAVFQGIRTADIERSLDYYIDTRGLKSVSPVKRYVSAISEFFKYCIVKGYIYNKDFKNELFEPAFSSKNLILDA